MDEIFGILPDGTMSKDCNAGCLFFIKRSALQSFSYGTHYTYDIRKDKPTQDEEGISHPAEYRGHMNKKVNNIGSAHQFQLVVEYDDSKVMRFENDNYYDLPYGEPRQEWNNIQPFATVLKYFDELEKYGEDGVKEMWELRRELRGNKETLDYVEYCQKSLNEVLRGITTRRRRLRDV